ncbi:MAG: amino acid adenylation domain-containing protein [Gammaproteobacteria bacterium]|nr:amino acid adenylation domain-containing protein [Gammaproteobacteria bacterium]
MTNTEQIFESSLVDKVETIETLQPVESLQSTESAADKQVLLKARLAGKRARSTESDAAAIPRQPDGAVVTLSFAQQRLWVLNQLVPGSAFYTESSALRFQAVIDPALLERAINTIVERHEVLRTTLIEQDGCALARVAQRVHIPLTVTDLSMCATDTQKPEIVRLATAEASHPFDLARGPLLRTALLKLGPAEWVFLISMHHIICDGWSSSVFSHELSVIYGECVAGRPCSLPDLPIQYSDYAAWQRNWLSGARLERQLGYWRERLAELTALDLPSDHPRPAVFSYTGSRHTFQLPLALTERLEAMGRIEGATLFMTLLAGFNCLLHRITAQEDIAIGTPIANRTRKELEPLIGFFVNTLLMRNDLSGRPNYREVLRRVRARALEAYDHQDLPFEKVVEDLQPERDLARNPLFQVMFQLHADQAGSSARDSGDFALIEVDRAIVKFDLRLEFNQTREGLCGAFEYSTDLFLPERIERLTQYLLAIYEDMTRTPDSFVADLLLVQGEERRQIAAWGRENTEYIDHGTIAQRFLEQAATTPNAVAITDGARTLTYRALRDQACTLAHRLREKGVIADSVVVVPAVRMAETIVAQLGILIAGGAYLPLDLTEPDERLGHMIATSRATLAVDATALAERIKELNLDPVALDLDATADQTDPPVPVHGGSELLAYIMYTSGSTGLPKGVAVPQKAVMRLVRGTDFCSMGADETMLLLASMTFDASTLEIWAPLLNGGQLTVYPPGRIDLDLLADTIRDNDITLLWLTAGLFHQIIDTRIDALSGVRQLLAGGDVLSLRHIQAFREHYPECRLINGYGPTENTTFSCCHHIHDVPEGSKSIPVGNPISGSHAYVIDSFGHLAPIGVPGELVVAGAGLARGYLAEPARTAEMFVPDPFNGNGARMYRTGDLVRFLSDGAIEFMGREDRQLKIRGYRVEPQEIETALSTHPDVADAAVIARTDMGGGARLVAYITPKASADEGTTVLEAVEIESIDHWRALYDNLYSETRTADRGFDITGWHSSYTNLPIPSEEMRIWLNATLTRIRSCAPRRVLEIGCGTGMLAFALADEAESYLGTDLSAPAVETLRRALAEAGLEAKIDLAVTAADDLGKLVEGDFDTVILNSVVQYFPGISYFRKVLDQAITAVAPGGHIFLGDLRSLPHLAEFHTAIQLAGQEGDINCADFLRRVSDRVQCERELLLDPALFRTLVTTDARLASVDIQWKRGDAQNELSQFRYDVILQVGTCASIPTDGETRHWIFDEMTIARLEELLHQTDTETVTVSNAPNGRQAAFAEVWEAVQSGCETLTTDQLRMLLAGSDRSGIDAYWQVAQGSKFTASVSPSQTDPATCTLRYRRGGSAVSYTPDSRARSRPDWNRFANNPVNALIAEKLVPELRETVDRCLPQFMHPAAYVVLGTLPLTANGKVDRNALPPPIRERAFSTAAEIAQPISEIERRLSRIWADVLGLDSVGIEDNFFELGGDSILSIQIASRAKSEGIQLTVQQLFENQTIAALTQVATDAPMALADQNPVTGPCGLTPAQAWMFENNSPEPGHFNQSILLQVPPNLDAQALDTAFGALLVQHDALRLRFRYGVGGWVAEHAASGDDDGLEWIDLSTYWGEAQSRELEDACTEIQASLDLADGPLIRTALFDMGPGHAARLLITAHHLVVDGVSWRILFEQLWQAYRQAAQHQPILLPAKTTSLAIYADALHRLAQSDDLQSEVAYWQSVPPQNTQLLPVDYDGVNTEGDAAEVKVELTEAISQAILTDIPQVFQTQINDVLLTAFARALIRWGDLQAAYFDLEGHGRELALDGMDLSRTVGWFTSIFPVTLRVDLDEPAAQSLPSVQEQLAAIPERGAGFGVLRYLSDDATLSQALSILPPRDISFNYLGQFGGQQDGAIRTAAEDVGPMRAANAERRHLIEVDGAVSFGRLGFTWYYSRAQYDADSIREIAESMLQELESIVSSAHAHQKATLSAESFPAARMDDDDFERLMTQLGGISFGEKSP